MSNASQLASQLIEFLQKHDQYSDLPEIVALLQEEVHRNEDITLITALPLSTAELQEISQTLQEKWGEHRVIAQVDSSLISGLIVKFQDKVIDNSGKNALNQLRHSLS